MTPVFLFYFAFVANESGEVFGVRAVLQEERARVPPLHAVFRFRDNEQLVCQGIGVKVRYDSDFNDFHDIPFALVSEPVYYPGRNRG